MGFIRRFLYRRGFRPKPGSIFFSPSLHWHYGVMDALKDAKQVVTGKVSQEWLDIIDGLPTVRERINGEIE